MEHYELVQEMGSIERMTTQDRLKHARKRRSQQLKKWNQYEKQLDKENSKKKKHQDKHQQILKRPKRSNRGNIKFAPNVVLLEAAARNDLAEVKRLLESGVNPDVTNEDGLTALHQCCIDDSEDLMKLLLDYNANVNACDSEMWTPLHASATCGHMNLCKHLIDRGAELLAVNADGNMPYDICEDELTLDYIETEMSKRGITQEQIDVTRLATEHQMLADVKEFVSKGGNLECVDHIGASMLHIAAANGYLEVAEFLLDNHVSVDTRDHDSWQPIHAAAYWAQQEILELLVESGADLDSKTKTGETPFDLCEEPDMKQKILDMKDEIETKRVIRQQRSGSQRKQHRVSSRNASIRRSSLRGDKSQLFKKEHKEEALHFGLNLMNDEEFLMEAEEEHDHLPTTDLDQVTITVANDEGPPPPPAPAAQQNGVDGGGQTGSSSSTVTTIHIGKPTPKPRSHVQPPDPSSAGRQVPPPGDTSKVADQNSGTPRGDPNPPAVSTPSSQPPVPKAGAASPPASLQLPLAGGNQKQPGPTLPTLKRERSNSRENLVDQAVQDMFLERVQGGRHPGSGGVQANSVASRGSAKTKNGHNNNAVHRSTADGQLRRFVAPEHAAVIGGDDNNKQNCCVIL